MWKNIKINLKKTAAEARRERFKTGGGPANKDCDELDELLTGIMESQQPLESIPDDLDSSDDGSHAPTLSILIILAFVSLLSNFNLLLSSDAKHFPIKSVFI